MIYDINGIELEKINLEVNNFEKEIINFFQVCPKEMLDKLENPITNKKTNLAS